MAWSILATATCSRTSSSLEFIDLLLRDSCLSLTLDILSPTQASSWPAVGHISPLPYCFASLSKSSALFLPACRRFLACLLALPGHLVVDTMPNTPVPGFGTVYHMHITTLKLHKADLVDASRSKRTSLTKARVSNRWSSKSLPEPISLQ